MKKIFKKLDATQLTVAGNGDWVNIGDVLPSSITATITTDATGSSVVGHFEYSDDKSTVVGQSLSLGLTDGATTDILPLSSTYSFVRFVWDSGTAATVDVSYISNHIN